MTNGRGASRGLMFAIFTLSGFSGLIYESIWSHYLKLFLGHAAYAQTLVLTVFMGGMALGAWLAARMSPRLRNLLLAYALVEAITGAIALAFHSLYLSGTGFTFEVLVPALDTPAAINAAKWVVAALLILPQSVLLGSTFPLISGGIVRRFPERPGATLAMLYFTNSLGAALGVLASGFYLIGKVGLPGTVMIAGALNIALAAVVWLVRGSEPAPAAARESSGGSDDAQLARRVLLAAFLSGMAAFIYEIAWIRMLSLVLGSSTHAFELMLSAFILGLAFGGLWIRRRIDSLAQPLATLAAMFAVMAILAICTLPAYGYTFDVIGAAVRTFPPTDAGYRNFNLVSHAVAAAVMIPTTFVAGMTLPIMTSVLLRRADERVIGRVYASNTVGAIAGVLLAVHGLLPTVGLKGVVLTGAILQIGISVLFTLRHPPAPQLVRARAAHGAGVALLLLVGVFLTLDPMQMASGVYRRGQARLPEDVRVLFLRDGKTATISLSEQAGVVTIATNGKPDATVRMNASGDPTPDEITMAMAAAVPLAMHPAPRQVANIGIGSGLTSNVVLAWPAVERLDSIEIEPAMARAAHMGFDARVRRLFEDPRSQIHFEDAKTFFSAAKRRYDVIISEPSNPWVSGVATLFSGEFYAQIVQHLNPDGLLVQWIQIYETDISVVGSIMKALAPHFDDFAVYSTDDANILIVARPHGALPALHNDLFAVPAMAAELNQTGLNSMGDVEIRRIGNKRMLSALFAGMPVPANSDFYPFVDLNAPRMRFLSRNALELVRLSLLPVPLAQIYGEPLRRRASLSVPSAQYFTRHRRAIEAQAIVRATVMRDPGHAPADARILVGTLRDADCGNESGRAEWLHAVHALSARTTPFLVVADRSPLWEAVRDSRCMAALTGAEHNWVALLEATARGDVAGIADHGERLFTAPLPKMNGNQVVEALIATAAAQSVSGKRQDARNLLDAYLPLLKNSGKYALALRLLEREQRATEPAAAAALSRAHKDVKM